MTLNRLVWLCGIALLSLTLDLRGQTTVRLYLEALDATGPVLGLTPDDVAVFDGGVKQQITRLTRSDAPMRVLLLVDTGRNAQPFIQEIRSSIVAFSDALPAEHELGLVTIGSTPVVRQAPSTDRTQLTQIAKTLTTGGTTVLVNAIHEMYGRFLRDAGDRWPILVIVTSDGGEGSGMFSPEKFAELGRDMQSRDAVVHAIVLMSARGEALQVQITRALTGGTGGRYETTATGGALEIKLSAFAQDLVADYDRVSTQYVLEYAGLAPAPGSDLKVTLLKDGIQMRMSRQGRIRN